MCFDIELLSYLPTRYFKRNIHFKDQHMQVTGESNRIIGQKEKTFSEVNTEVENGNIDERNTPSENKQKAASKKKRAYKRKKRFNKNGRILTDFAYAKSKNSAVKILFKGAKAFKKKILKKFTKDEITLPENLHETQLMLINSLKVLRNGGDIIKDKGIKDFFNSYNISFKRNKGLDKDGKIINERLIYIDDELSWKNIIAYNLIRFLKLDNYSKYIGLCRKCEKYFIPKKSDQRIRFCERCSSKYGINKKSAEEKMKEEETKKADRIQHMIRSGNSREEAEEYYKIDKE